MNSTQDQLALAHQVNQTLAKASEATGLLRLLLLKGVFVKLILEAGEPGLRDEVEQREVATKEMAIGDDGGLTYFGTLGEDPVIAVADDICISIRITGQHSDPPYVGLGLFSVGRLGQSRIGHLIVHGLGQTIVIGQYS